MIKIWLDNNKTDGHDNLKMHLMQIDYFENVDTYYFALDNLFMENDESTLKVSLNIKKLLNYWAKSINELEIGQVIFLPFDFSDQYIGCLRIQGIENDKMVVNYGDTQKFNGTSINPSQFSKFKIDENDYSASTDSFVGKKSEFIDGIKSSITNIMESSTIDNN